MKKDLSILIVNYRTYGMLYKCLDSIKDRVGNYKVEIFIIDNTEKENRLNFSLLELKKMHPNLIIIRSGKNSGYAGGVNQGLKKASGRFIAVINPDVTLLDGCLETLCDFAKKNGKVGMIGPKLITDDGKVHSSCRTFPGPFTLFYKRMPIIRDLPFFKKKIEKHMMVNFDHNSARKVDWISGSFMFLKKDALEKIGFMDERFFMYMEDVDWCRRFWQGEFEIWYCPQATAIHTARHLSTQFGLLGFFRKISWIHLHSYIKYFHKYLKKPISYGQSKKKAFLKTWGVIFRKKLPKQKRKKLKVK